MIMACNCVTVHDGGGGSLFFLYNNYLVVSMEPIDDLGSLA